MKYSPLGYLLLLLTVFSASGASCRNLMRSKDPLAPVAFVGPPTLDDVVYSVNTNSARVQQLSAENATVSTPGVPSLRATLALDRPRKFRLRAKLISQELDMGSNDELFWLWAKSDPEHAIYYAYHDQFVAQAANQGLPVGPDWLIESLGLVQLDPAGQHEGPTLRTDQRVEVRSRLERNGQPYTRLIVLDSKYGWIVEQAVLDATGKNLAVARCSDHRFYQEAGTSLPHRVQIELPSARMSFQIEVGRYRVNQLQGDEEQLWSLPHYDGYQLVNIATPLPDLSPAGSPHAADNPYPQAGPHSPTARSFYEPRTSYRPSYRGVSGPRQTLLE